MKNLVLIIRCIAAYAVLLPMLALVSFELGIKIPRLKIVRFRKETVSGETDFRTIFISVEKGGVTKWIETLRHEARHIWQYKNYRDVVLWCSEKEAYRKDYWFYFYSPIEMDARFYGKGGKSKVTPLNFYSLEELEAMYQEGGEYLVTYQLEKVASLYGVSS